MTVLFGRDWALRVGGIDVSSLDFDFDVTKTRRAEPNRCSVKVWGLSPENQRALEQLSIYDPKPVKGAKKTAAEKTPEAKAALKVGNIRVELEAGYLDPGRTLIFRGDLRRALNAHEGVETCTEVEGGDGGRSVLLSRVSQSFPVGTPRLAVVSACAAAMGLGVGNLQEVAGLLAQPYTSGTAISGNAATELGGVLRRAGITYSIQDQVLLFSVIGRAGNIAEAVVLSSDTGLVGSPEKDCTGVMKFTSLIQPGLVVGGYVSLHAKHITGTYRIETIRYEGSTYGNSWYAHCEALPG